MKRTFIRSDLAYRQGGVLSPSELADYARGHPDEFMRKVEDLISARKLTLRSFPDLQSFFRAFLDVQIPTLVDVGGGHMRSITTSAFPLLMGSLVVAELNRAYEDVPTVGHELVTDMESNKKFTHIAKIHHLTPKQLEVAEGAEFPLMSSAESFTVIGHKRKGFQLAITQEVLEENDLGGFIELVSTGGGFSAEVIEEQTLARVCDQNGSAVAPTEPRVYRPNGAAAALYSTTATPQTPNGTRLINNALVDDTDIENAQNRLAGFLNTRGRKIHIPPSSQIMLVPHARRTVAWRLTAALMTPGIENDPNPVGPSGINKPGKVVSTPKLDDISASAWYLGDFKRQFRRKWKIRTETVSVYADPMQYLRTREAYRTRVCWDVEVGAVDNVFVVQSLEGTEAATAPAASSQDV